jgi:hypothetical protein
MKNGALIDKVKATRGAANIYSCLLNLPFSRSIKIIATARDVADNVTEKYTSNKVINIKDSFSQALLKENFFNQVVENCP